MSGLSLSCKEGVGESAAATRARAPEGPNKRSAARAVAPKVLSSSRPSSVGAALGLDLQSAPPEAVWSIPGP
eukprot:15456480-Alexandrium_andersonii.AAC.1